MAEPTCVMPAFSYTSPGIHSNESHNEGNPLYGIGDSISLGKYMSESLSWEKWSTFSRNRYVEEAEQYSKPGSVAQKKAYFEAHFKRMAALKAAALLEQANSATNKAVTTEQEAKQEDDKENHEKNNRLPMNNLNPGVRVGQIGQEGGGSFGNENSAKLVVNKSDDEGKSFVGENDKAEAEESAPVVQTSTQDSNDENCIENIERKENITTQKEKSQLQLQDSTAKQDKSATFVKKNPSLSSYLPSVDSRTQTLFSSSPAAKYSAPPVYPGKENYATPIAKTPDRDRKKRTPLRRSINRELNKLFSPVIKKIGSSTKGQKDKECSTPLQTPAKGFVEGGIENPASEIPKPAKRGVRALFESARGEGNKPFSPTGLKSPGPNRNKLNPAIIPTFCLRSRDTAPRRKENLEEKFNAKAAQRSQQQSKLKGKAEAEFSKLRQSFCFKSTPMSDLNGQTETSSRSPKHKNKLVYYQPSSKGKKTTTTTSSTSLNSDSLPPRRPALKNSSKNIQL